MTKVRLESMNLLKKQLLLMINYSLGSSLLKSKSISAQISKVLKSLSIIQKMLMLLRKSSIKTVSISKMVTLSSLSSVEPMEAT